MTTNATITYTRGNIKKQRDRKRERMRTKNHNQFTYWVSEGRREG